jgi:hypothetical protein
MRTATRMRFAESRVAGVLDDFNRANTTNGIGTSSSGAVWSAILGSWGISSNQAYCSTADTADHVALIESGKADLTVSADILMNNTNPGLIFRGQDGTNYMMALVLGSTGQLQFYKRVAGTYTSLGLSASALFTSGTTHNLSVTASGSSLVMKLDGTTRLSITDSTFATQTKVGFRNANGSSSITARWDNLMVL